jgi:hypothetical protein
MRKYFDIGSITVIAVTFLLFTVALFTKGLTHDILLEAGILLVSVKLIMMAYRNSVFYKEIIEELKKINNKLNKNN